MSNSRIPADKSASYSAWALPEVKRGQIVQAEKLKHRGPRGELIGVAADEIVYNTITAAQLEEISQAAYEDVRESAYREGIEQGRREGYDAGLEMAETEVSRQVSALQQVIQSLMSFLGDQDDQVEQALVNLSICLASSILRRELTIDSSQIAEVVHEALKSLPVNTENLTVYLSQQDHELLSTRESLAQDWQLRVDPAITPGGCRVTTRHSVVDFTLEDQFQQAVNALVEERFAQLAAHHATPPRGEED